MISTCPSVASVRALETPTSTMYLRLQGAGDQLGELLLVFNQE